MLLFSKLSEYLERVKGLDDSDLESDSDRIFLLKKLRNKIQIRTWIAFMLMALLWNLSDSFPETCN